MPRVAPVVDSCFSNTTKSTYVLNTKPMAFEDAETFCQTQGGHLAAWNNLAEQMDAEQCFVDKGNLMPAYHTFYWMGLKTGDVFSTWPNFTWIDKSYAIFNGNYQHWGYTRLSGGGATLLEPNNLVPPENCAGGNFSEAYGGASGWGDTNCSATYPMICEIIRE
jgi:hypothetical protein